MIKNAASKCSIFLENVFFIYIQYMNVLNRWKNISKSIAAEVFPWQKEGKRQNIPFPVAHKQDERDVS